MKFSILLMLLFCALSYPQSSSFINGVDLSYVPKVEANGGIYSIDGTAKDPLQIFADNELNYVRLRLWHTPVFSDDYAGLSKTIAMAQRVKLAGLKLLLDFHYSDTWADPGKQYKPAAWINLSFDALSDSVYAYTFNVIKALDDAGALPDMVQVGNEITPGMLWNDGRVGGSYDTQQQWQNFTTLLKSGISAVHDAASDTVKIMIHIDRGGNNSTSRWFFDHIRSYNVNYDVIGLSYYPFYSSHGTLSQLRQNINDISLRYNKDIIIAETAYPWTLQWYDNTGNIVGNDDPLHQGYPASEQGQYNFIYDLIQIIKEVPNGRGKGLFYWEPAWISAPTFGSAWENLALFDFSGNALSSLRVFKEAEIDTSNAVNVTFTLNTSTNYDTLLETGFAQLRGEIFNGADVLASGENLAWSINSEVILQNVNGDYWQRTVRVTPGTEIHYAYWTGHTKTKGTFLRLGSEGPITPFNGTSGNVRKFIAGEKDTILQVEYYNGSGVKRDQYWRPFDTYDDSLAVYLRVNMRGVTAEGRFDPASNGPTGVRGEDINSLGILSWDNTNVVFERETLSVAGGSFWSGVVYYPKSTAGTVQQYKFFIDNDTDNGWENSIANRSFTVPYTDTTIHWVYFDNNNFVTGVEDEEAPLLSYNLYQNYPNPFNNSTLVRYEIKERSNVNITVYDILGKKVSQPFNAVQEAGIHSISWDGKDHLGRELSSGVYMIKMDAQGFSKSIKAVLLR